MNPTTSHCSTPTSRCHTPTSSNSLCSIAENAAMQSEIMKAQLSWLEALFSNADSASKECILSRNKLFKSVPAEPCTLEVELVFDFVKCVNPDDEKYYGFLRKMVLIALRSLSKESDYDYSSELGRTSPHGLVPKLIRKNSDSQSSDQ